MKHKTTVCIKRAVISTQITQYRKANSPQFHLILIYSVEYIGLQIKNYGKLYMMIP